MCKRMLSASATRWQHHILKVLYRRQRQKSSRKTRVLPKVFWKEQRDNNMKKPQPASALLWLFSCITEKSFSCERFSSLKIRSSHNRADCCGNGKNPAVSPSPGSLVFRLLGNMPLKDTPQHFAVYISDHAAGQYRPPSPRGYMPQATGASGSSGLPKGTAAAKSDCSLQTGFS